MPSLEVVPQSLLAFFATSLVGLSSFGEGLLCKLSPLLILSVLLGLLPLERLLVLGNCRLCSLECLLSYRLLVVGDFSSFAVLSSA